MANTQDMNPQVMAMPRVKFLCGRDWFRGPNCWQVGVLWDANPWPREGEFIYRRRFVFQIYLDRGLFRHQELSR